MFERLKMLLAYILAFLENTTAQVGNKAAGLIGTTIGAIIYIYLIPTFVEAVTGIDTSAWNFTGYTGAIAILFLLPLVFVAGVVIWVVKNTIE